MAGCRHDQPRWTSSIPALISQIIIPLIACFLTVSTASAQPLEDTNAFGIPVTVTPPRDRLRAMYEAATLAEREQYPAAARALQTVLESPEDYFLERDLQTSLKQRALSLLATWPQAGREAYELQFSVSAAIQREQALRTGRFQDWSTLLSQYWMTPAGRVGVEQWAAKSFDAGQPLLAGMYWSQLRETHGIRPDDVPAGLREALAWELAGRADLRRSRLALFGADSIAGPIALGGRVFDGAEAFNAAIAWLGDHQAQAGEERGRQTVREWPAPRGHAARNGVAWPAGPIGVPAWSRSVLGELCEPLVGDPQPHRQAIVRQSLVDLEERLATEDRLTWPAAIPLVSRNTVVIRTLAGLAAFDLSTGALRWRSALDESLLRRRWNALATTAPADNSAPVSDAALQQWMRERIYRDSVQGAIACDQRTVYAIESNLEPPPPPPSRNVIRPTEKTPDPVNRLVAFDLDGGQLLWELGGPDGEQALPLAGHFFLGPPLIQDERLYCLAEYNSEMRLLQLQVDPATRQATLEWSQVLVAPDQPVSDTQLRRLSGLTPTWADGLLLCPTGCGVMIAVDPLRRQLAWGFKYDSLEPRQINARTMMMMQQAGGGRVIVPLRPDEEQNRWIDAVPIYAQGNVLFTPRDSAELHCLDAVTGEVRWKRPRGSSLTVAGVQDDRVIVIGRSTVEALRLSDGGPVWTTATPLPVGQGLLLAERYLLPVLDNEVLTLDLTTGRILSRSRFDPQWGTGNLVAAEGALITASARGLSKFVSLSEQEAELTQRLTADANDAAALSLRGELRLHRGDEAAGLADLRDSLKRRPDSRTAALLASTLIDGLRTDFPRYRQQAEEINRLVTDAGGRSEFLRTYAQALANAGERTAAFAEYLKLANLADDNERLERVSGGWSVRVDRIVRGHVKELYQAATPTERQALDAALRQYAARDIPTGQAAQRERSLLRFFDGMAPLDDVRLKLIQPIEDGKPPLFTVLAARQLTQSPQPAVAVAGAAWLTQTLLDQQRFSEVAPWLNRLNGEWKSVRSAADAHATGADIATKLGEKWTNPLAKGGWGTAGISVERKTRNSQSMPITPVDVVGPRPAAWQNWTFEVIHQEGTLFLARDPFGQVRWKVTIPVAKDRPDPRFTSRFARHFVHIAGDTMALSLNGRFAVLDLTAGMTPSIRWQHDLSTKSEPGTPAPLIGQRVDQLPSGRRRYFSVNFQDPTDTTPAGQVLGLTDEWICYLQGGRLIAADVETGRILWIRLGLPHLAEGTATADAVTVLDLQRGEAVVYRPDDGAELARRTVGESGNWLWFQGDNLLTVTPDAEGTITARHEKLSTDTVLWERRRQPVGTRYFTADGVNVWEWSPSGQIAKLRMLDGSEQWRAKTPILETTDFFWTDHYGDVDLIHIGSTIPTSVKMRISGYDPNQISFQGRMLGLNSTTGQEVWSAELEPTAIDLVSRPNLPILPCAARQIEQARIVNGQFIAPTRFVATFFDKRNGDVLYKTTESLMPHQYQFEVDENLLVATASFPGWMVEFRKDEE